jgi:hypothetical protein
MPNADEKQNPRSAPHWAEITTLIVVLAYTIFAGGQWCTMRSQLDIARDQLKASVRPQLAIRAIGKFPIVPDESGLVDISLFNAGPGIAIQATATVDWWLLSEPEVPDNYRFDRPSVTKSSFAVIAPGDEVRMPRAIGESLPDKPQAGFTAPLVDALTSKTANLWLLGRIEYCDSLRNRYFLNFCERWIPGGDWIIGGKCNAAGQLETACP